MSTAGRNFDDADSAARTMLQTLQRRETERLGRIAAERRQNVEALQRLADDGGNANCPATSYERRLVRSFNLRRREA